MSRFYSLSSWFCTSVAIALAVIVPLTVPEEAFADAGSTCASQCSAQCANAGPYYPTCYEYCIQGNSGSCCAGQCNGDPTCQSNCCNEVCGNDQICLQACGGGGCSGTQLCSLPTNPCNSVVFPLCPGDCSNGTIKNPCNTCQCTQSPTPGQMKCGCYELQS